MFNKLRKNRQGLIMMLIISTLATTLAVSLAFLTARSEVDNSFLFKELVPYVNVTISEPNVDPENVPYGQNTKPVLLVNDDNELACDAVVRVSLIPVSTLAGDDEIMTNGRFGNIETSPTNPRWILGDISLWLSDTWSDDWLFKDGYFYYKKVLKRGESTAQLLKGVTLSNQSYYQNMKVQVNVLADAVDAGDPGDVNTAFGVNVDNDGNVTL